MITHPIVDKCLYCQFCETHENWIRKTKKCICDICQSLQVLCAINWINWLYQCLLGSCQFNSIFMFHRGTRVTNNSVDWAKFAINGNKSQVWADNHITCWIWLYVPISLIWFSCFQFTIRVILGWQTPVFFGNILQLTENLMISDNLQLIWLQFPVLLL